MNKKFQLLIDTYRDFPIQFPHLKPITLAQWALECGWGQSLLFQKHNNAAGLKWRSEMAGFARPVVYKAHDGDAEYCKFISLRGFITGYWKFLDRSPYRGWKSKCEHPEDFINFVGPIYCPDKGYVGKVLSLLDEATTALGGNDEEAESSDDTTASDSD